MIELPKDAIASGCMARVKEKELEMRGRREDGELSSRWATAGFTEVLSLEPIFQQSLKSGNWGLNSNPASTLQTAQVVGRLASKKVKIQIPEQTVGNIIFTQSSPSSTGET